MEWLTIISSGLFCAVVYGRAIIHLMSKELFYTGICVTLILVALEIAIQFPLCLRKCYVFLSISTVSIFSKPPSHWPWFLYFLRLNFVRLSSLINSPAPSWFDPRVMWRSPQPCLACHMYI